MKLFLASSLDKTISLLMPLLSKPAKETKVIFIANAADHYKDKPWVDADRKAFIKNGFTVSEIDLRKTELKAFAAEIEISDILHLCGGSVFYLLKLLKQNGFDKVIVEAIQNNKIFYTSTSAGSIIVSESVEAFKYDEEEAQFIEGNNFSGLGIVNFLIVPHCNDPKYIVENKHIMEYAPEFKFPLLLLNDNQTVFVEGDKFKILSV